MATSLIDAATAARRHARAGISGLAVGAAIETVDGVVVTGCNVENATLGLTMCAERVALLKALSEGHARFTRIAIVASDRVAVPPCGACRQLLWEFAGDLEVVLAAGGGRTFSHQLKDLLPTPFDARLLDGSLRRDEGPS